MPLYTLSPLHVARFKNDPRRITHLTVVLALLMCTGCVQPPSSDDAMTSATPSETASVHSEHKSLPLPERLAFMTGHVEAGLALYRAGEPQMAAPHLAHPVSETHASERVGLDALGFDADLFIEVSKALEAGIAATAIEAKLIAAENNLAAVSDRAGGDPKEIIHFLLDTISEEYAVGVRNGRVTDPGEYQDAFGFTVVAIKQANKLGMPKARLVQLELEKLLAAWPSAPVPPPHPTPIGKLEPLIKAVRATLDAHHR